MNVTNSNDWADQLLPILEQQHTLVQQLDALAKRQGDLIRDQNTTALLDVLAQRQALIDQFLETQNAYSSFAADMSERIKSVDSSRRMRIEKLIAAIEQSLDSVMQRDERDRAALEQGADSVKRELAGMGTARKARQAYLGAAGGGARFADRQG